MPLANLFKLSPSLSLLGKSLSLLSLSYLGRCNQERDLKLKKKWKFESQRWWMGESLSIRKFNMCISSCASTSASYALLVQLLQKRGWSIKACIILILCILFKLRAQWKSQKVAACRPIVVGGVHTHIISTTAPESCQSKKQLQYFEEKHRHRRNVTRYHFFDYYSFRQ